MQPLDYNARSVTFAYKNYADDNRTKMMPLQGLEFIRRFLPHLLPVGFTKIRHYGLLRNNPRKRSVALARTALGTSPMT